MTPYRTPPPDWSNAPPIHATAWTSSHHHARIGRCDAEVRPETPRDLPPYWAWKVTRDNHAVVLSGSAMNRQAAMAACERGAELLSDGGWPSAFAPGGIIT